MQQKASVPIIVVAVVVVVGLMVFLGKMFLAPAPTNPDKPVFPSFIDPATGKPKAGMGGGSGVGAPKEGAGTGVPTGGASGGR